MAALLQDRAGFKEKDIVPLTDQQTTKARILEALRKAPPWTEALAHS